MRGDEAGFDKADVAVYGLGINPNFEETGQMQWANFTGSLDWDYLDENPWARTTTSTTPASSRRSTGSTALPTRGTRPPPVSSRGDAHSDRVRKGRDGHQRLLGHRVVQGSRGYGDRHRPGPVGPTGERASLFNGVADSISASSKNQDAAWEWVKFLGSTECQDIVAEHAVVFPRSLPQRTRPLPRSTRRVGTSRHSSATARRAVPSSRRSP
ncbi:hypothetical protein NKG05_04980 [Oerskovia sp. M15]